ncbi:MAG: T9SS type A sorting domain-containing protein, partial [Bacteroidota bacterium]
QPLDGVFAGVLSKDSTFTIEFDARVDVATPNVYEIIAYTELEGDMNAANDTFRMEIINIPNIIEYPYFTDFEDWSSGWRPAENSRNSSWEFGRPSLGVNTAASGENAWMTALNSTYNASERSYLISPCLDFTSLEEDPVLSFSLFLDTESCCDEAWIESSVDGGDTWSKVIENEPSLNWYNDQQAQQWDGTTGLPGWVPVMNRLIGTAGEAEVLLRIVFSSDASTQRAGIGVDNIFISEPLENDMATVRVAHTSLEECGETEDEVQLEIVNLGQNVQRGFEVYYQINGGAVITEQINVPVAPLETLTYTFEQTFSSNAFNRYTITAGVIGLDDELEFNNLAKTTITNIYRIPFVEDFESRRLPEGWTTSEENNIVTIGHNAPSFVASDLLFSGDNFFEFDSPTFGTVTAMDSFSFAYRFVNFDTPGEVTDLARMLAPGDSLLVLISTDCGENYLPFYTVDRDNHMPSETMQTVRLSLADFSGQNVKFRFRTYRGALGEFYIDLDNISIKRCPANLDLVANIINVSTIEQPDGQITVRPRQGLPPYYYVWSTQDSTPTITNLVAGRYTVTVTDAVGCSDVLEASVSVLTEVMELDPLKQVNIAPNPTAGNSQLSVELHEVAEVNVRVFNSVGQQVKTYPRQRTQQLQQTIDLTGYENGLYFVQLWVNGRPYTKRLVVIQY